MIHSLELYLHFWYSSLSDCIYVAKIYLCQTEFGNGVVVLYRGVAVYMHCGYIIPQERAQI